MNFHCSFFCTDNVDFDVRWPGLESKLGLCGDGWAQYHFTIVTFDLLEIHDITLTSQKGDITNFQSTLL